MRHRISYLRFKKDYVEAKAGHRNLESEDHIRHSARREATIRNPEKIIFNWIPLRLRSGP